MLSQNFLRFLDARAVFAGGRPRRPPEFHPYIQRASVPLDMGRSVANDEIMVKVSSWLRSRVVRPRSKLVFAPLRPAAAASVPTAVSGLTGLVFGLLAGCVEVPLPNQVVPPDASHDGGTKDMRTDMGGGSTTPTWRWESPQPQGNNLRALWGVAGSSADQDQVYAGGDNGTLLIGGAAGWQSQRGGVVDQRAILSISGMSAGGTSQALAVGFYDLALQRSAGQWSEVSPDIGTGDGALTAVWATPTSGEYYSVGTTGRMYHVTKGGISWTREGSGVTTDSLFGIAGTGSAQALELYAVGDNGRIVHRTSGAWKVEADNLVSSQLNAVWIGDGTAAGEVFAVGNSGTVLHKQGTTWGLETAPTTAQLTAAWGSGGDLYVVGAAGTILHRKGGNWQPEGAGLTTELLAALWGTVRAGQITLYAAGNFGTLLRLDNGIWKNLSSRVTANPLSSVWARNPGEIYAAGSGGLILRRSGTAASGSWKPVADTVTSSALNAITGWSPSATAGEAEVYAVGTTGTIVHKSGTTWSIDGAGLTTEELTGVWAGQDSVYVVGRGGRIYRKTNGSWSIELGPGGVPVTDDLGGVWGTGSKASEVVYVVGGNGLIIRHDMLGWAQEGKGLTAETLVTVFGNNEDNLYAFGNKGAIVRRLAGKWQLVQDKSIGTGAPGIAGCVIPSTQDLLAIADQGVVTRRTSGTWIPERSLTLLPYSGVAAAALEDYYIVGSNGLILHKY